MFNFNECLGGCAISMSECIHGPSSRTTLETKFKYATTVAEKQMVVNNANHSDGKKTVRINIDDK